MILWFCVVGNRHTLKGLKGLTCNYHSCCTHHLSNNHINQADWSWGHRGEREHVPLPGSISPTSELPRALEAPLVPLISSSRAHWQSLSLPIPPSRQESQGQTVLTVPEPDTKTLLPRVTPALLQAWIPTERGSMRAPSSKVTLSGSLQEWDTRNSHQCSS